MQGWHYGNGADYRPVFRLAKLAFLLGIALALRKADFVCRNIGL